MKDFNFYAPTQVAFGKSSEERLPELIRQYGGTKVLVHYGGQSARKSGLLQKVFDLLNAAHLPYIEMGGVVPNPLLSMVYQGIELCRREKVDFIYAEFLSWSEDFARVMCGIFGRGRPNRLVVCL